MPVAQFPSRFRPFLTSKKRFNIAIGGRGSAKSESVGRLMVAKAQMERADILCGREFQSSIDESVHKLLKGLIEEKLQVSGFSVLDQRIDCLTGGGFRFKGFARNSSAVKSAQDFKYSWIEEAQTLGKQSLRDLTPTIRLAGSQLYFTANPQASGDPFSKRFIVPYLKEITRDGFYEDDMHLIVMMNWRDNPWFNQTELPQERLWDYENLDRAEYDHIWEGAFNDSVEDAIITAEWFDAAIDAHKKLGFEPRGIKSVTHDPSDKGPDPKGLCIRHGVVILEAMEKTGLDINEGCDWATGIAINERADVYIWDCDGMGVTLRRQTLESIAGKHIDHVEFKGSLGVEHPKRTYQAVDTHPNTKAKTNYQTFKNLRAQKFISLADRFHKTYLAVVKSKYIDPDELISISSDVSDMAALRTQMCRIPTVPNGAGLIQIMDKPRMQRLGIDSPNIADAVMMSEATPSPRKLKHPDELNAVSVYR